MTTTSTEPSKSPGRAAAIAAISLGLSLSLAGLSGAATTGSSARDAGAKSSAPRITFGECHVESTPPFEESRSIECNTGQVIVAVYENAVRCCTLRVH